MMVKLRVKGVPGHSLLKILVIAMSLGLAAGCSLPFANGPDEALGERLETSVDAASPGAEIQLTELAPFQWDVVRVFAPGTPASRIESDLGFSWSDAKNAGDVLDDDLYDVLVFVRNREVVRWTRVTRRIADFPGGLWSSTLSDDVPLARFRVVREPFEGTVLEPIRELSTPGPSS